MQDEIIGIIGGSGFGDHLEGLLSDFEHIKVETPFGSPSSDILTGKMGERKIAFLNRHGKGHRFSPSDVPYRANIYALKKIGVRTLIATAAVGSLQEQIRPGELVIVEQFIDKTVRRENSFFIDAAAVHCEFANPTCAELNKFIAAAAENLKVKTHHGGTYVCMEGPQFSTRAESIMHRQWGGDLIGMTAMPEAKLAREAQICYSLIALATDYDCWKPQAEKDKHELLKEIIGNLQSATNNCLELVRAVLKGNFKLVNDECSCRKSLELAVWTQDEQISETDKEKLKLLFD
ncbi:MAG: S-methyl-5'-thioadenosine phosphorylase [Phycisphaerae bacterium]|nr:S-methyl-5'-thioadenosine phosphorylase [Phycisphaerae bacterium]